MKFDHIIKDNILIINFTENLIVPTIDQELIVIIEECLADDIVQCAVDLSEIRYMNSSGIGLLMRILAKFRNQDGEVVLINPSPSIQNLLLITKLNAIFTVVNSIEEAVRTFKE
jgi:anti-sigma B factor antagonist